MNGSIGFPASVSVHFIFYAADFDYIIGALN